MIPDDAWPQGDRLSWSDDETRLHYDFTEEPWATTPYSEAENAAADERIAATAAAANEDALSTQARSALDVNRAYLALASPTNAQTLAQVKALTRQMIAVARLTVGDLNGTD